MSKAKKTKPASKDLQGEIDRLTEALKRDRADTINIRKRHEEQMKRLKESLKADLVKDLLPVIDNFERALAHTPGSLKDEDYVKGVQGIVKQFEKTLKDMGVEKIKTVGEKFDPNLHEAVSTEGEGGEEIVSEELQSGYRLGDEVIRHAMVKVKS